MNIKPAFRLNLQQAAGLDARRSVASLLPLEARDSGIIGRLVRTSFIYA